MAIACWLAASFAQTTLDEALDFSAQDINNPSWSLFETLDEGRYVCLFFYSVECTFCKDAAPKLSQAFAYFGCNNGDVFFLGINHGDSQQAVSDFETTYGLDFPSLSGMENGGDSICKLFDIQAHPTTILISPKHQICEQDIWPIPNPQFIIGLFETYAMNHRNCQQGFAFTDQTLLFLVSPNPASSFINIYCPDLEELNHPHIRITDVNDRLLQSIFLVNEKQRIGLSQFEDGCYLISLFDETKIRASQKISLINRH